MKYEIAISQIVKGENDITLTLNTANGGSIEIRSYGAKMNYEEFTEFADVSLSRAANTRPLSLSLIYIMR